VAEANQVIEEQVLTPTREGTDRVATEAERDANRAVAEIERQTDIAAQQASNSRAADGADFVNDVLEDNTGRRVVGGLAGAAAAGVVAPEPITTVSGAGILAGLTIVGAAAGFTQNDRRDEIAEAIGGITGGQEPETFQENAEDTISRGEFISDREFRIPANEVSGEVPIPDIANQFGVEIQVPEDGEATFQGGELRIPDDFEGGVQFRAQSSTVVEEEVDRSQPTRDEDVIVNIPDRFIINEDVSNRIDRIREESEEQQVREESEQERNFDQAGQSDSSVVGRETVTETGTAEEAIGTADSFIEPLFNAGGGSGAGGLNAAPSLAALDAQDSAADLAADARPEFGSTPQNGSLPQQATTPATGVGVGNPPLTEAQELPQNVETPTPTQNINPFPNEFIENNPNPTVNPNPNAPPNRPRGPRRLPDFDDGDDDDEEELQFPQFTGDRAVTVRLNPTDIDLDNIGAEVEDVDQ
jgi:hypothetical protein